MLQSVKVSRKGAFWLFSFLKIACVVATIVTLFLPYMAEVVSGVEGESQSIFGLLKDILKIENSKMQAEYLKLYKWPIVGAVLLVVGALCGLSFIFSSKVSEGKIKFGIFVSVVGIALAVIGVYFTAPSQFISNELKDIYDSLDIEVKVAGKFGATVRFASLGAAVLGLAESLALTGRITPAREAMAIEAEQKRQEETLKKCERTAAVQTTAKVSSHASESTEDSKTLENRLQELILLKEKGLLTEEEYLKKRTALIESY